MAHFLNTWNNRYGHTAHTFSRLMPYVLIWERFISINSQSFHINKYPQLVSDTGTGKGIRCDETPFYGRSVNSKEAGESLTHHEICDRGKREKLREKSTRTHFVQHETHMEWPRCELGSLAVGGERLTHGCAKVAHCVPARWRNFSHYCRPLRQYDVFWAQRSTDRRADSRRCTHTSD